MTRSVDIVIVGATADAISAAIESAQRGDCVLMVVRSRALSVARRVRRSIRASGPITARRISVVTGARVECVAGVHSVEAVLLRRINSRKCVDVNASALLDLETTKRS